MKHKQSPTRKPTSPRKPVRKSKKVAAPSSRKTSSVAKKNRPKTASPAQQLSSRRRIPAPEKSQLQAKLAKLESTAHDLSSLLNSTEIAVVFLDARLCIRRFTPAVTDLLHIDATDLGRPLNNLRRKFNDRDLLADVRAVLKNITPLEAEVVSDSGRAYVRRALPYRNRGERIDGVVLTFIDITRRKLAETALRTSEERHRLILDGVAEYAILILDQDGRFVTWSTSAERILGFNQSEALGQPLELIYTEEDRVGQTMHRELQQARDKKSITEERWHLRKDGNQFWGTGVFSALYDESNRLYGFVMVLRDITERKKVEEALQ